MSYARRNATEKPSAELQAALDKRAALMLKVHEARLAGLLTPASLEEVELLNRNAVRNNRP